MKRIKRLSTDAAGYALILTGLLISWIPGPGGIPLIVAGLGLLAIHNNWAKRILELIKQHGAGIKYIFFPNNRLTQIVHDIVALILLLLATWFIYRYWYGLMTGIGISFAIIAVVELLLNRDRLLKIKNKRQ